MPILPPGQDPGQALGDLLGNVNRPQLNSFVATSQARNGLVSAQTQDALIKASQAQEEMAARDRLQNDLINQGAKLSDAQLLTDTMIGLHGSAESAFKAWGQTQLAFNPDPAAQTRGQQAFEGKIAGPVTVPNNYIMPQGSPLATAPVQQSPQGEAQTKQTTALTGLDVARAEDEHQKAKNAALNGITTLTPDALHEAALVTMADPTKMSTYAGYGQSGNANRNAINNERARMLNEADMTTDDMMRQRAMAKASAGAAGQAAKQQQTLEAFMPLIKSNGDRVLQLMNQINAAGGPPDEPIINGFSRMLGRQLNSDDLAELHSVMTGYQAEVSRLLAAGPSMNGVISDHARDLVNGMAPENMSARQASRVINRIDTEINIRHAGIHSSLEAAANAQVPVIAPHQPGNTPAPAGSTDDGLPPGFHRLN